MKIIIVLILLLFTGCKEVCIPIQDIISCHGGGFLSNAECIVILNKNKKIVNRYFIKNNQYCRLKD